MKAIFLLFAMLFIVCSFLMLLTEELTFVNVVITLIAFATGVFSAYMATETD